MNDLNTLLLQGTLVDDVIPGEKDCATLRILNHIEEKGKKDESVFEIIVKDGVAEGCRKILKKGDRIRALCKLVKIDWNKDYGQWIIAGEHIEKEA